MKRDGIVQFHTDLEPLLVPLDSIRQHPANPNNGDVEAIAESIEVNGYVAPVIVQRSTGYIIAGNHRWEALHHLGAQEIPAVFVDMDDYSAKRYLLADNRTAALAQPDNALLLDLLNELNEHDSLHGTGYRTYDLEVLRELNKIEPDYDDHATWPLLQIRVPPHVHRAYYAMTEAAVGERERLELLMRLAGWDG